MAQLSYDPVYSYILFYSFDKCIILKVFLHLQFYYKYYYICYFLNLINEYLFGSEQTLSTFENRRRIFFNCLIYTLYFMSSFIQSRKLLVFSLIIMKRYLFVFTYLCSLFYTILKVLSVALLAQEIKSSCFDTPLPSHLVNHAISCLQITLKILYKKKKKKKKKW